MDILRGLVVVLSSIMMSPPLQKQKEAQSYHYAKAYSEHQQEVDKLLLSVTPVFGRDCRFCFLHGCHFLS
jgi:hypothetical protein